MVALPTPILVPVGHLITTVVTGLLGVLDLVEDIVKDLSTSLTNLVGALDTLLRSLV